MPTIKPSSKPSKAELKKRLIDAGVKEEVGGVRSIITFFMDLIFMSPLFLGNVLLFGVIIEQSGLNKNVIAVIGFVVAFLLYLGYYAFFDILGLRSIAQFITRYPKKKKAKLMKSFKSSCARLIVIVLLGILIFLMKNIG